MLTSLSGRLSGIRDGFGSSSMWEKGLILVGILVLAILAPVAYFVVFAGGGGAEAEGQSQPPQAATGPTATEAAVYIVGPTDSPNPTATIEPTEAPATATATPKDKPTQTQPPNRRDCSDIAGTPYQSPEERDWFLANCQGDEPPVVVGPPTGGGPSAPTATPRPRNTSAPPPPPPPTPTSTPNFPSDAALAYHAADWLLTNTPGVELVSGSCGVARVTGSQWIVTCTTRPAGCVGSECSQLRTETLCVTSPSFTVWRC